MGMSHPLLLSPTLTQGKLFTIYLAGSSFLLISEASPFQRLSLTHQNVQQSGLLHITVSKVCMLLKLVRSVLIIYQQLLQVVFMLSFHDSSSSCAHKKLIFLSFSPVLIASVRWSSKTGQRGLAIGKSHIPVQAGTLSPSLGCEVHLVLVGHPQAILFGTDTQILLWLPPTLWPCSRPSATLLFLGRGFRDRWD